MGKNKRNPARVLVHASCGAFLAALSAISVHFWWTDINWLFVGIAAVFGFLLAGFLGDEAIEFLKQVFWWS